ncbi:MAG TPA: CAP domain-containing protein [Candidatus Saccharimonadales bacterium]|nr:CAP domain-containing protein [Candidatus Saccharimonadales bacterium]
MVLAHLPKHRQTIHDKKRLGRHHKPTKHYSKTYWPYLPMLLIVVGGIILNATWQTGKGVLGFATDMSASTLLQETNMQRSQNGAAALSLNSALSSAAQAKANDMASHDYWSHITPDGKQPWQFIADAGYTYSAAAENLAYGFASSGKTVAGWMNSAGHRANLLNTSYQEVGFGIANTDSYQNEGEQTIVVAMYAKPYTAISPSTIQNGRQTATLPATTNTPASVKQLNAREVSRVDVLTNGNAQWVALAASALASMAILAFVLSHAKIWKRYLIKGESFFIKHPLLDTALVAVGVLGFLLTRTSGFIH